MNVERRINFANAVINSDYNVICLCETWLNDNIPSSELFLNNYCIYRQDRQMDQDKKNPLVIENKKFLNLKTN